MKQKCERCGSKDVEYHDNYVVGITTIECNDCGLLRQYDTEE